MTARTCDWCFRPLADACETWNGGIGHIECVAWAEAAVLGHERPVYVPLRRYYRNEWQAFLERLGGAAVKHGIDPKRLARAIAEARI
jgi:hypothetical protein